MSVDDEFDPRDPPPTAEDLAMIASAPREVVAKLDKALMDATSKDWRKMARLVGDAMLELDSVLPELSDSYYAYRLRSFIEAGALEARGDVSIMRFCEIRRPAGET